METTDTSTKARLIELWIECDGCGRRLNLLESHAEQDCGCGSVWHVLPERTKRAA
jgi:hypothetical protein